MVCSNQNPKYGVKLLMKKKINFCFAKKIVREKTNKKLI